MGHAETGGRLAAGVGDVTGDGRADVVGYHPSNGTVWVGENRGATFALTSGRPWPPRRVDDPLRAFHGKGEGRPPRPTTRASGTLWVGENPGSAFAFSVGTVPPGPPTGRSRPADFIGNGRTDVVGAQPAGRFGVGRGEPRIVFAPARGGR